jgi:hypothetical protein
MRGSRGHGRAPARESDVIVNGLSVVLALLAQVYPDEGTIRGLVVNASRDEAPVGSADVVLRVQLDGDFIVAARTITDQDGRFVFEGLPVDPELIYLAGAHCEGIVYPGRRIRLSPGQPYAHDVLKVQEAITEPNPLVIRDYAITLEPGPGALRVTETMLIENPEPRTFVGKKPHPEAQPVTLRLGIPAEFERVTFREEFYARQFSLINERLVTGLPWTPGRRALQFSYVIRNEGRSRLWARPLDLPCDHVSITVSTNDPDGVSSNLGGSTRVENGTVTFEGVPRELPAGHLLRVELSRLPVPVMAHARWIVLGVLVAVIAGSCLVLRRPRGARGRSQSVGASVRPGRSRRRQAQGGVSSPAGRSAAGSGSG